MKIVSENLPLEPDDRTLICAHPWLSQPHRVLSADGSIRFLHFEWLSEKYFIRTIFLKGIIKK